jgi:hypothetical protein
MLAVLGLVGAASLPALMAQAQPQPSADQVLADVGLSPDDKQRVLNGEFVTSDVGAVSERDLSFGIAFLVKTTPASLATQIEAGDLITADTQVQAHGRFSAAGSLADLAGLRITDDEAKTLANARAGEDLNLSTAEIAAFKAVPGGTTQGIQQQLHRMLLARYQAYRASGLAGIAPYDRGGSASDLASDLRKASEAAKGVRKYVPGFHAVLLGYPKTTVPGMQEDLFWVKSDIHGKPTYVLTHVLVAPEGAMRGVVQRQYYVSTGYNAEQAVAGFVAVQGGTIVLYAGHAFTDQVTGFGGSMKRGIGRRVMADQMKKLFDAGRRMVQ